MTSLVPLAAGSLLASALVIAAPARADGTEATHRAWRDCLDRTFSIGIALTGPNLAAEAALRRCRGAEEDYLAALSASPLLDENDVARARPALAARAQQRLLGRGPVAALEP